jgi:ketosteroid isomerase-like protein
MIRSEWTVMSQSVLGGTYHSAAEFQAKTLGKLGPFMDASTPIRMKVHNIIGGGPNEEWCTVEMRNESKTKSGMDYNQTYGWCVRWSEEGKIVQVRAYLDTALLKDVFEANE